MFGLRLAYIFATDFSFCVDSFALAAFGVFGLRLDDASTAYLFDGVVRDASAALCVVVRRLYTAFATNVLRWVDRLIVTAELLHRCTDDVVVAAKLSVRAEDQNVAVGIRYRCVLRKVKLLNCCVKSSVHTTLSARGKNTASRFVNIYLSSPGQPHIKTATFDIT